MHFASLRRHGVPGAPCLGLVLVAACLVLALPGVARAHVTVYPKESPAGAFEAYTVRVPTEREVPTVRVEVAFPEGVTVSRFQPKPGWEREVLQDASGRIVGVVWSGGTIGAGEFDEFRFQARNPKEPGALAWKAVQTYEDGERVEWKGPEGSEHPASVTRVVEAAAPEAGTDHPGGEARREPEGTSGGAPASAPSQVPPSPAPSRTPLWPGAVSLVALAISLAAGGLALRRR